MSNATLAVSAAVSHVEKAVEKVINDADQFFPEAAAIGDAVRQGDVYIQLIDPLAEPPLFYSKLNKPEFPFQLAPGNTKGSRHMLEHSDGIEVWVCDTIKFNELENNFDPEQAASNLRKFLIQLEKYSATCAGEPKEVAGKWNSKSRVIASGVSDALAMCGPIFVVKNRTTVSHPEHGNWILPAGTYRITFQRTLDQDMRVQRVFD